MAFCSSHRRQNLDKILANLFWPRGPVYLRTASLLVTLLFIVYGIGEEVTFEEPGQGGASAFNTCISLLHSLDLGIIIAVGDDVACGQVLEVDDVVRRDNAEGLLDAKVEGALEPLSHPVTQRSQATDQ